MSQYLHVKKPGWVDDFRAFIMRGNVVDLAVGVVIGAAFTGIVGSLVKDILTPFIGLLTGGVDFSNLFFTLKGPVEPTLADAVKAGDVTVNYGVFLNAVINFIIVATAIFVLVQNYVSAVTQNWMTVIGLVFVLSVMFFPLGVLGFFRRRSTT